MISAVCTLLDGARIVWWDDDVLHGGVREASRVGILHESRSCHCVITSGLLLGDIGSRLSLI